MKCPYCNNEMEQGTLGAYASGSIPVALVTWTSKEEIAKKEKLSKSVLETIKNRKEIMHIKYHKMKNYEDENAWYCSKCHKAFGEFQAE